MSLEIRPLAALYPPPYFLIDSMERGENAVGMIIPHPATTESGDRDRSSFCFYVRALDLFSKYFMVTLVLNDIPVNVIYKRNAICNK